MAAGATISTLLMGSLKTAGVIGRAGYGMATADKKETMLKPAVNMAKAMGNVLKETPGIKQGLTGARAGWGGVKKGYAGGEMAAKPFMAMTKGIGSMAKGLNTHLPGLGKLGKPTELLGMPKKLLGKGMGMLGINLSLSSLLRQSQLFTGILGALFQILGGFVDVILAPFMPLFVSVIRKLASFIPIVAEYAQKLYDWLETNVFPIIKKGFDWIWGHIEGAVSWIKEHMPEIKEYVMSFWSDKAKPFLETAWETIQSIWGWLNEHIVPVMKETVKTVWEIIQHLWGYIKDTLWPAIKSAWEPIKKVLEHVFGWLKEEVLPRLKSAAKWLIDEVGGFFAWALQWFAGAMATVVPLVTSIMTKLADLVATIVKPLWDALEPVLKWIMDTYLLFAENVLKLFDQHVLPFLQDAAKFIVPKIKWFVDEVRDKVLPEITKAMERFFEFADAFLTVVKPILLWLLKVVWSILEPLLKLVIWGFKWIFKGIGFIFKIGTWLLTKFPSWVRNTLIPFFQQMWGKFRYRLWNAVEWLKQTPTHYMNMMKQVVAWGSSFIGKAIEGVPFLGDMAEALISFGERTSKMTEKEREDLAKLRDAAAREKSGYNREGERHGARTTLTINNISDGKIDLTTKIQLEGDIDRKIENAVGRDTDLMDYSRLGSNLKIA